MRDGFTGARGDVRVGASSVCRGGASCLSDDDIVPAAAVGAISCCANATAFRAGDVFSADGRNASFRLVLYDAPQLVVREDGRAAPR